MVLHAPICWDEDMVAFSQIIHTFITHPVDDVEGIPWVLMGQAHDLVWSLFSVSRGVACVSANMALTKGVSRVPSSGYSVRLGGFA